MLTARHTIKSRECGILLPPFSFFFSSFEQIFRYLEKSEKIAQLFNLEKLPDGCEMLERHCRTKCWLTPSITHAEQMTQFPPSLSLSFSSSRRVYQRCPEYLAEKRAHPWDLICTGVHLVEVVWDNLHIMSHLHQGFTKNSVRIVRDANSTGRFRGARDFKADTVARSHMCDANPQGR